MGIGFAGVASANTIHVCSTCAHTSIQAAANDAVTGDTISIAAGRYVENIRTAGKNLTFIGQSAGSTFVYASGTGPVFTLGSAVVGDPNALITIRGLTISNGNHYGGSGVGGGVQVRVGAYLHIQDSTITENTALAGGGIGIDSPGAPETTIIGCLIHRNGVGQGRLGGAGGGVSVGSGSTVTITDTMIMNNEATADGGGISGAQRSTIRLVGTTVSANRVDGLVGPYGPFAGDGGGISADGTLTAESSYILNNINNGNDGGGGLSLKPDTPVTDTLTNTLVAQNSGADGGAIATFSLLLVLNNSYVVQNRAYGIYGNAAVQNNGSTIKDNDPYNTCLNGVCK
jgi:hypothetical protein